MHKNNWTSSKTKTFLTEYFEPEFDNNLHLGLAPLDLSTTAATSKHAAYNSVIEAAAPGARSEGEEMPKEDKVQGAIREDEESIDHRRWSTSILRVPSWARWSGSTPSSQ